MIEDILDEEQIQLVEMHIRNGVPYNTIRQEFPHLGRKEIPVLVDYYKKRVQQIENKAELGFKDEPYYNEESVDELYPQYSWKDLSHHEKSWYNVRIRNKIK